MLPSRDVTGPNLLDDPLRFERPVPPCAIVIFGASGDLTRRKLIPAFYRLAHQRRLPHGCAIVGVSRTPMNDDQFRDRMRDSVARFLDDAPFDPDVWAGFALCLFYCPADVTAPASFEALRSRIEQIERERQTEGNLLFYLATHPGQYEPAARAIGLAFS